MILVGHGHWGRVLHRIFSEEIEVVCDLCAEETTIESAINKHRGQKIAVIATPPHSHFEIAEKLLHCGYDIWIEKPATASIDEIDQLIEISEQMGSVVLVDHTYCYDDNIQKIKHQQIHRPCYYRSIRLANGPVRQEISPVLDLAVHDLSILDFLFPDMNLVCSAVNNLHQDHVILNLSFDNGLTADIECGWSFPVKKRIIMLKHQQGSLLHDSADSNTLKIFDHNLREKHTHTTSSETLLNVKQHFLKCVEDRSLPVTNLYNSRKIISWIL